MASGPCWFCHDEDREDKPPGGWVYEDSMWRVGHAPASFGPAGLVILESRRHFLDPAEMTTEESIALGPLLGRLFAAVKDATSASRVYLFSTMAQVPHFHAMLIPWSSDQPSRGPEYVARMPSCSDAAAERAAADIRRWLAAEA